MSYNVKNYTEQGGETTHFGGKVVFEEGVEVTGLAADPLTAATADTLGGIKVGDGLSIEDGVLSADPLTAATAEALGGVIVGEGLTITDGVLSVDPATPAENQEDSEAAELADLVTDFNALLSKLKAAGIMEADEEASE